MLDWNHAVRDTNNRTGRALPNEVIAEIAAHLEDSYDQLRLQGLGEAEAVESVLRSVADWRTLQRAIRKSRCAWYAINQRTGQLWIPGLITLLATNLLLLAFLRAGIACFPKIGTAGAYLVWLSAQPLIGALGAHLSQSAGGLRAARLVASLFPSIVTAGFGLCLISAIFFFERNTWASTHLVVFVIRGLAWVGANGIALLFGALPFLELRSLGARRIVPRTIQP